MQSIIYNKSTVGELLNSDNIVLVYRNQGIDLESLSDYQITPSESQVLYKDTDGSEEGKLVFVTPSGDHASKSMDTIIFRNGDERLGYMIMPKSINPGRYVVLKIQLTYQVLDPTQQIEIVTELDGINLSKFKVDFITSSPSLYVDKKVNNNLSTEYDEGMVKLSDGKLLNGGKLMDLISPFQEIRKLYESTPNIEAFNIIDQNLKKNLIFGNYIVGSTKYWFINNSIVMTSVGNSISITDGISYDGADPLFVNDVYVLLNDQNNYTLISRLDGAVRKLSHSNYSVMVIDGEIYVSDQLNSDMLNQIAMRFINSNREYYQNEFPVLIDWFANRMLIGNFRRYVDGKIHVDKLKIIGGGNIISFNRELAIDPINHPKFYSLSIIIYPSEQLFMTDGSISPLSEKIIPYQVNSHEEGLGEILVMRGLLMINADDGMEIF